MKSNSVRSRLVRLATLALVIPLAGALSTGPLSAVSGENVNKELNYGLHWFKMDANHPNGVPNCGNSAGHNCLDAVSNRAGVWGENTNGDFPLSDAYDPDSPTIIYFHGWQPDSKGKREDFWWTRPGAPDTDILTAWKTAGWNVGIFYWNQFADNTTPYVSRVEGKMWSSKTNYGLWYRYDNGSKFNKKPTSQELGLPALSTHHTLTRWDNKTTLSQAISAVKFIDGTDPTTAESTIQNYRQQLENGLSCSDLIQQQVCPTSISSPLCGNGLDHKELLTTKICQTPSVGDLAVENLNIALQRQNNETVIFAGHSLGHQLATRTATHMWLLYSHYQNQGSSISVASNRYQALPKRLELLDPYATSATHSYLSAYTWDGNNLNTVSKRQKSRTTYERVYNYVKRLKQITAAGGGFSAFDIPVSYFHTSYLGKSPGSTTNPDLIHNTAYQRHFFDIYPARTPAGQTARHNAAKEWYFLSREMGAGYPHLQNTSPALSVQQGLSSRASDAHVREAMLVDNSGGVSFKQTRGMNEPFLNEHEFTATTLAALEWPGGVDMSDADEAQTAIERRLFNHQITITADNWIDAVYMNGENVTGQLGATTRNQWTAADTLSGLDLHNGYNVLAVKATDAGGVASLLADLDLGGEHHVSDVSWRVTSSTPGSNWMELDFDDSSWEAATPHGSYGDAPWYTNVSGIANDSSAQWIWSSDANNHNTVYFRFVFSVGGPWKVRLADTSSSISSVSTAVSLLDAAENADLADGVDDGSTTAQVLNFSDGGNSGLYGDDQAFPNQPATANTFAIRATGSVTIETADFYTFGFNVDDGARITLTKDGVETVVATLDGLQPPTTRLGQIYLAPGEYEIEVVAYENSGGAAFELFAAKGYHTSWNADDFKLLLPHDHLEVVNQTEEDTSVCYDLAAGITVGRTGNVVTHNPYSFSFSSPEGYVGNFFAQMQTYDGPDTAMVQTLSVDLNTNTAQVKIDEEQSLNPETTHTSEVVGHFAVDDEFPEIRDATNTVIGVSLNFNMTSRIETFTVPYEFNNPVALVYLRGSAEPDATHVRVDDLWSYNGSTEFRLKIRELYDSDGVNPSPGLVYVMLIEKGVHYMRDGQIIQAGDLRIYQTTAGAFTQVNFPLTFASTPVVMSSPQYESLFDDQVLTRQRGINTSGFQVMLQEPEADDQTGANMVVGWVAITGDSPAITSLPPCP